MAKVQNAYRVKKTFDVIYIICYLNKIYSNFRFNGREGLVLYNINYNDNGKVRPIMYRAALSEMWIPYGDPRPPYHRKAVRFSNAVN